jgi:hypothetical protein
MQIAEICCYLVDWSSYEQETFYYSFNDVAYHSTVRADDVDDNVLQQIQIELGFQAVTVGTPKSYKAALSDPKWGDSARIEWQTLIDSKAIVEVDSAIAKRAIAEGADVVIVFPVYEEKMKEGQKVYMVRLVGNGKTQYKAGITYSPTPSREEFLILLHILSTFDWECVHIDEVRAFLNAPYKGDVQVFARLAKDLKYYKVKGALCGLKTSPRHYNQEVVERLDKLGFKALHTSSCIFVKRDPSKSNIIIIISDFADDFVITANSKEAINIFISEFRAIVTTALPVWNSSMILSMGLCRDRDNHTIAISLRHKIMDLCERHGDDATVWEKHMSMPHQGCIVDVTELAPTQAKALNSDE